jgi:hypothetical protein
VQDRNEDELPDIAFHGPDNYVHIGLIINFPKGWARRKGAETDRRENDLDTITQTIKRLVLSCLPNKNLVALISDIAEPLRVAHQGASRVPMGMESFQDVATEVAGGARHENPSAGGIRYMGHRLHPVTVDHA